ncbi:uncharacterized protein LOC129611234 isoform X6 [Condylostylus longicornis]|uniref:uncharacterized protein LOC129611234 isoform X6 n=1 Tax=Condylostylus longicornis TaxID=2530218 RepID=UPI00244DAE50|nr:uncharacterized protein LOC129611234 isoform X6 [Condylostylus longicornis]
MSTKTLNPYDEFDVIDNSFENNSKSHGNSKSIGAVNLVFLVIGCICLFILRIVIITYMRRLCTRLCTKWCCESEENRIALSENEEYPDNSAPVVVTSSTHVPPNAGVNYPVDEPVRGYQTAHTPYSQPSYPMPQPAPVHTGVPYPINNTGMPMPQTNTPYPPAQPVGYQAPYPPAQNPQDVLPPSYDQVVGTTGPASAPYNKQAPYNPHYTGN